MNARSGGIPDDHDLPLPVVRDVAATPPSQKVAATPSSQTVPAPPRADQGRAIWFSYACHCTVAGIVRRPQPAAGGAGVWLRRPRRTDGRAARAPRALPAAGRRSYLLRAAGSRLPSATAAATRPRACRRAGCRSPRRAIFGVLAALLFFSRTALALESPLAPDDALKAFQHEPDVRVELVAAEPLVMSPCAMAFDERGRLFVAENRGYPNMATPPQGDIALLEDTDGDGHMDRRTVFADALTFPNGVMPWRGGVIVTCAPDVLFFKDTDGDGKADERKVLLTGFATDGSTQLRVNCPTLGPDGWIYFAAGLSGGEITSPEHPERPALKMTADLRWNPQTGDIENTDGRSQYGMSFDDFGRRFICMNRLPVQHVVLSSKWLARNPHLAFSETVQDCNERSVKTGLRGGGDGVRLFPISENITTADSHAGSFSAACAITIWRGGALPEQYRGCAFSCDPTGNLVHVDRLIPRGATFAAEPLLEGREFLAARDDWHRPVFLASGPDGALYICDMYRKTIEHPDYLPEEIRKRTDFASGQEMGRIWKVSGGKKINQSQSRAAGIQAKIAAWRAARPEGIRERAVSRFGEEKIAEADRQINERFAFEYDIDSFSSRSAWQRDNAYRLMVERPPGAFDRFQFLHLVATARQRPARLYALALISPGQLPFGSAEHSLTQGGGPLDAVDFAWLINHGKSSELENEKLPRNAADNLQLAIAFGNLTTSKSLEKLVEVATCEGGDKWTRAAVLSGIAGRERAFAELLVERLNPLQPGGLDMLAETCRLPAIGDSDTTFLKDRLTSYVASANPNRETFHKVSSFLAAVAEGLGHRFSSETTAQAIDYAELVVRSSSDDDLYAASRGREFPSWTTSVYRDPKIRLSALRLLGSLDNSRAKEKFSALDWATLPADLRAEWIRLAMAFATAEGNSPLLHPGSWKALTPPVQASVIFNYISRPQLHAELLDALEAGTIATNSVSQNQRDVLLKANASPIRERAEKLFGPALVGDRTKAFDDAKAALALKANAEHGREVFKTLCATCHRLDREGYAVGPDLFDMRNQPKESILFHIVVPEAEVAPAFAPYLVETRDGRALSGILASETKTSLTLRMPLGVEETILRANVAKLEAAPGSLMPAGLDAAISRQDLADLLGYLKGER